MTGRHILTLGLVTFMLVSGLFVTAASAEKSTKVKQVRAQLEKTGIQLQWQPITGADGYRIYHQSGTIANHDSLWFDVFAEQTSVLYSDVQPLTRYSFRIAALNGSKQGPLSAPASVVWKKKSKGATDTAP